MTGEEGAGAVIAALHRAAVPFMVVGSFSRNYYAFPRSTNDADIVIQASAQDLERVLRSLPSEIKADPQISFEAVTGTRRNVLGHALDFYYICAWADRHGTRDLFEEIYRSVEELF